MSTAFGRLLRAELKLMLRDPLVLTFVFVFPVLTMLIIGGSFGTKPDPGFANVNPAHWYVASYLTRAAQAVGLMLFFPSFLTSTTSSPSSSSATGRGRDLRPRARARGRRERVTARACRISSR